MESSSKAKVSQSAFDKKPLGERFGNKNAITKKIKANPKYAEVKSVIKQGKTMKDVEIISDNLIAKRKGEHFGRIKGSTLAKFLSEATNEESVFGLMQQSDSGDYDHNKENSDVVSTTGSILSVGAESVSSAITCTTDMLGITSETKFILLDLRDDDEYKMWHIKEAINFPAPNISRDKMFGQLLRFKNLPDKIIVVYMMDERAGTQYSKLLHEKGFDNVYLLSGGLEKFFENYPELVEGAKVPEIIKPKTANSTQTGKFKKSAASTTTSIKTTKK